MSGADTWLLHLLPGGRGLGVGKAADEGCLDVAFPAVFRQGTSVEGSFFLDDADLTAALRALPRSSEQFLPAAALTDVTQNRLVRQSGLALGSLVGTPAGEAGQTLPVASLPPGWAGAGEDALLLVWAAQGEAVCPAAVDAQGQISVRLAQADSPIRVVLLGAV